jgi:molybdopterin-binding protein
MKLSARNQLPGTVISVTDGAVNGTVKVDLGHGLTMTSSITEEAIADLGLRPGDAVTVVVKASDVMIAK